MYVGWLFDSNQNEVTVIPDYEFSSTRPQTPSHFHIQLYQKHKSINTIFGNWIIKITTKKTKLKYVIQQNQNRAHKTLLEEAQKL
jgi:hypothetical protein